MRKSNKHYFFRVLNHFEGAAVAELIGLTEQLNISYPDKTEDIVIWEGENPLGLVVAERKYGEWNFKDSI